MRYAPLATGALHPNGARRSVPGPERIPNSSADPRSKGTSGSGLDQPRTCNSLIFAFFKELRIQPWPSSPKFGLVH